MNIAEWNDYGETLAGKHNLINHVDQTGRCAFEIVDVEEAFSDVRNFAGEVLMRWLIPTFNTADSGGNPMNLYSAGFMILVKHARGRTDSFVEAIEQAQIIADEVIARIRYDAEEDPDMFVGGLDNINDMNVSGVPIKGGGDGHYSGWLITLRFYGMINDCVTGSTWTDL